MTTELSLDEFAKLVNKMRQLQKEFFRTRSSSTLQRAKAIEDRVDKALAEHFDAQKKLF